MITVPGASPGGRLLALPTIIRLGRKGFPGSNTLADIKISKLRTKSFITLALGEKHRDELFHTQSLGVLH